MSRADPTGTAASICSLRRATRFLRDQTTRPAPEGFWSQRLPPTSPRVIGNWLDELDRLLRTAADALAMPASAPAPRATWDKLASLGFAGVHHEPRLRGMKRAVIAFRYMGGVARRADHRGGSAMTAGWFDARPALRAYPLGDPVSFDRGSMIEVCDLYDAIAAALPAPFSAPRTAPRDRPPPAAIHRHDPLIKRSSHAR